MELGEQMREAQENSTAPTEGIAIEQLRNLLTQRWAAPAPVPPGSQRAGPTTHLAELSLSFPSDKRGWCLLSSYITKLCCKSQQII